MLATAKVALRNLVGTVTAIKATPGTLVGLQILNTTGASAYVQLFDAATSAVNLGTTTPIMEQLVGSGAQVDVPLPSDGILFTTAISAASATAEGGGTGSASGVMLFAQIT